MVLEIALVSGATANAGGGEPGSNLALWAGLVVNLALTVGHYIFSTQRAKRQTEASFDLEEFSSQIRTPIETELKNLRSLVERCEQFFVNPQASGMEEEVKKIQESELPAIGAQITELLHDADRRDFVKGSNWTEKFENGEDILIQKLDIMAEGAEELQVKQAAFEEYKRETNKMCREIKDSLHFAARSINERKK